MAEFTPIALGVKPLQVDVATPLLTAARIRHAEMEQQKAQTQMMQDAAGQWARGVSVYADKPEFAQKWAEGLDDLHSRGLMPTQAYQRMRDNPSPLILQSILAQTTSPELAFRREESVRTQGNADRAFGEQKRQFEVEQKSKAAERALTRAQSPWIVNPDGSLAPRPGGEKDPAYIEKAAAAKKEQDKALPAELGARVGMAGKFLDEFPLIRERVAKGDVTGPVDAAKTWLNMGSQGEIGRKIKSGTDALLRNLTGAGMPDAEARKYVSRYEPQVNDSAATVLSKMDQLQDELRRIEEEAYRGRGGLPKNKTEARQVVRDAMDAIAKGAPRDKVMQELKSKYGISFGDF